MHGGWDMMNLKKQQCYNPKKHTWTITFKVGNLTNWNSDISYHTKDQQKSHQKSKTNKKIGMRKKAGNWLLVLGISLLWAVSITLIKTPSQFRNMLLMPPPGNYPPPPSTDFCCPIKTLKCQQEMFKGRWGGFGSILDIETFAHIATGYWRDASNAAVQQPAT